MSTKKNNLFENPVCTYSILYVFFSSSFQKYIKFTIQKLLTLSLMLSKKKLSGSVRYEQFYLQKLLFTTFTVAGQVFFLNPPEIGRKTKTLMSVYIWVYLKLSDSFSLFSYTF